MIFTKLLIEIDRKSASVTPPLDLVQILSFKKYRIISTTTLQGEEQEELTQTLSKEKEEVGEVIYEKLVEQYPNEAAKLTGMLLQMDYKDLVRVIAEPDLFKKKVQLALSVLKSGTENPPPELPPV